MSGYGGNLTYPKTMILLNELDATKVGLIDDGGTDNVLFVRTNGLYLKGGKSVVESNPIAGVAKKMRVTLSNACPCSLCSYDYGFSIYFCIFCI